MKSYSIFKKYTYGLHYAIGYKLLFCLIAIVHIRKIAYRGKVNKTERRYQIDYRIGKMIALPLKFKTKPIIRNLLVLNLILLPPYLLFVFYYYGKIAICEIILYALNSVIFWFSAFTVMLIMYLMK